MRGEKMKKSGFTNCPSSGNIELFCGQRSTLFFHKNKDYKNVEPHFVSKTKNLFYAEIGSNRKLFVIFLTGPIKRTYAVKR